MSRHHIDLASLKVGDEVHMARAGSWDVMSIGFFTVIKADKLKVIFQRVNNDHQIRFSVKTGDRWNDFQNKYEYSDIWVESVEAGKDRISKRNAKAELNNAWKELEKAVESKNIEQIKEKLMEVEKLQA